MFQNRISKCQYLLYVIIPGAILLIGIFISGILLGIKQGQLPKALIEPSIYEAIWGFFFFIVIAFYVVSTWFFSVKRLHDLNKSGIWILAQPISGFGSFWILDVKAWY